MEKKNDKYHVTIDGQIHKTFDTFDDANKCAMEMVCGEHSGSNVQVVPENLFKGYKNVDEQFAATVGVFPESKKNDRLDHKVRMELLPMDALEAVAKIYTFGAEKYGVGTWRQLADGSERYRAALLRHMTAECKGEELDPESGLPHVFHEAWNAIARVAIYLDNKQ